MVWPLPCVRSWPTTMCSREVGRLLLGSLTVAALVGPAGHAAAPTSELRLVEAALAGSAGQARVAADDAAAAAAQALGRRPSNPVLDLRHEQANGPAGASTDVVGAAWTLGLGLPVLAEQQAADKREVAAWSAARARRIETICGVREATLEAWRAHAQASLASAAHGRLEGVAKTTAALSEVGELSQHEHARTALALAAHQAERDQATAAAHMAAARVEAWTGQPLAPGELVLLPLSPLPDEEETVSRAVSTAPRIAGLRAERAAVEAEQAAARRAALPELTVAGGGRWDALPDGSARTPGFEVGAALELPVFDRNQSERSALAARLAALDAALARERATVEAGVRAHWRTAATAPAAPPALDENALWQSAVDRTLAGEESLEALLGLARDLEAAAAAQLDAELRQRAAHLALSCALGAFPQPALQALLTAAPPEVSR